MAVFAITFLFAHAAGRQITIFAAKIIGASAAFAVAVLGIKFTVFTLNGDIATWADKASFTYAANAAWPIIAGVIAHTLILAIYAIKFIVTF